MDALAALPCVGGLTGWLLLTAFGDVRDDRLHVLLYAVMEPRRRRVVFCRWGGMVARGHCVFLDQGGGEWEEGSNQELS